MALGQKLVEELQLEPSVDTLGRWMAYDLAGLLYAIETAGPAERPALRQECRNAILKLWSHRAELPNGHRPFEDIEPILRAVESLDPTDTTPRYFRSAHSPKPDEETYETQDWLKLAEGIDYTAKLLIGYCLSQSAQGALDKSKEWVAAAQAAGLDRGGDMLVLRFVSAEEALGKTPNLADEARKVLEDRIKRLEAFRRMAKGLVQDFKVKLEAVSSKSSG